MNVARERLFSIVVRYELGTVKAKTSRAYVPKRQYHDPQSSYAISKKSDEAIHAVSTLLSLIEATKFSLLVCRRLFD